MHGACDGTIIFVRCALRAQAEYACWMSLVVVPLSPPLARLVTSISYSVGDDPESRRERILSDGSTGLMVNLHEDEFRTYDAEGRVFRVRGAMLAGPRDSYTVIPFSPIAGGALLPTMCQ
jgi:hypothetical protein